MKNFISFIYHILKYSIIFLLTLLVCRKLNNYFLPEGFMLILFVGVFPIFPFFLSKFIVNKILKYLSKLFFSIKVLNTEENDIYDFAIYSKTEKNYIINNYKGLVIGKNFNYYSQNTYTGKIEITTFNKIDYYISCKCHTIHNNKKTHEYYDIRIILENLNLFNPKKY